MTEPITEIKKNDSIIYFLLFSFLIIKQFNVIDLVQASLVINEEKKLFIFNFA
jgi:hypothetical protein